MTFETIDPWDVPHEPGVYVLRCADTSGVDVLPRQTSKRGPTNVENVFYVGESSNIRSRIEEHFAGNGSEWTQIHPPAEVIYYETEAQHILEKEKITNENWGNVGNSFDQDVEPSRSKRTSLERKTTERLMHLFGYKNVRGWKWSVINLDECNFCPPLPDKVTEEGITTIDEMR